MPKAPAKTDRGHIAFTRTSRSGAVSTIKEKAKKIKAKKPTGGPRFAIGEEIYYRRPGEDQKTKRGHIKSKSRTGWVVIGRPDGAVSAVSKREIFVPDEHVLSAKQYEAKKKKPGTREATSSTKRTVSVEESNRRAKAAATRFPYNEEQVITHPKIQSMMAATVTSLATKNQIHRGPVQTRGGIKWSTDNLEYNDLVSDYLAAAANGFRREVANSPQADLDAFAAHLSDEESGSRIFATITTEGRGAVMRHLKERAERFKDTEEYVEDSEDPGQRRRMGSANATEDYMEEVGDGLFDFGFDERNDPHLWNQPETYDPTGADPYEQMRYREAIIDHFVAKLTPAQKEVVERKYALGNHLEPQTNSDIADALKRQKLAYPEQGKDWNRQTVTPVHNAAITTIRTMENIDPLRDEYLRSVPPKMRKSLQLLTPADFFKALRQHLEMVKSIGPCRSIAPGIVLRRKGGSDTLTFDPKMIAATGGAAFAKSFSSDIAKKNPGGKWITVKQGPLSGRHIFILPHKDGTATVLTGGGPAMRHKLLQPKKEDTPGKKSSTEGDAKPSVEAEKKPEKPELTEERRTSIESSRVEHKQAIREEKQKLNDIVREHLGTEVELTAEDRANIEKKVENIADPKVKAAARMRETFSAKKERDEALAAVLKQAKESVVNENPTGEGLPTISAVVKAHAEDLLQHHYRIEALKREDRELGKLLKTGNDKRPVSDQVSFAPLSKEDLKKVIVDEDLRDKEMAAHYKLVSTVKGYVDKDGDEHKAKGGEGVGRNVRQGGYEAITGMVGELTGNSIMTKAVYDEIGPRNAAILAHYYLNNSGIDSKKLGKHLEEDMATLGSEIATRAVRRGDEFMEMSEKIKGTGYGAESLMEAAQARGAALKYVNKAYETYAQAQGALNQAAELAYEAANEGGKIEIGAGSVSTLDAKRKRMGLKASDVSIAKDGDGHKMTVKPQAIEKLLHEYATPKTGGIAGEGFTPDDIKAHRANTDDFRPQGIREYTPPNKEGIATKIDLGAGQQAAVRFIDKQKRVYLNYEAGTGKSLTVIAAKAHLEEQSGEPKKMIVSMPSPIMKNFAAEVAKFSDYKVAIVEPSDTPEQRRAKYNSGPDTIVIVNHEKMNFDGADIAKAGFHMVVADEAHTVTQKEGGKKSFKSEGLKNVAGKAEHYIAMSGTPVPNNLSELYFHAHLINPEKFGSQKEFMARFGSMHKGEGMKAKIADFMNRELSDHVITAKKGTMLKPNGKAVEMNMKTHFSKLSETQRNEYRATVAAVKSGEISQLQAENRMKKTLNDAHHSDNGKFDDIKKLIDHHLATKGPTEKISLYTHSYAGADNLHEFLEKHYPEHGVVRFANKDRKKDGEKEGRNYTGKEKAGFVDKFKHDAGVRFAIHTTAGTTGLNVQHDGNGGGATTVIAVASGEAGYSSIDQFFSRAYRTGANRNVDAHMVLTDTPYDMGTKLRLDEKKAVGEMIRSEKETPLHLLLIKSHVKQHSRITKNGGMAIVKDYDDSRRKKQEEPGTDKLKDWATGTKIVDSKGRPLKVYHGTHTEGIKKFKVNDLGAIFFSTDRKTARSYGKTVMPVYLSMKNPLVIDAKGKSFIDIVPSHYIPQAKELGHDGVVVQNMRDDTRMRHTGTTIIAFKPNQIKSANTNSGDFNSKTADIHKSHIKASQRKTASGAIIQVKEHDDKRKKKEFTHKIKPHAAGFIIESDDGGGLVIEGKPQPIFMGGNSAKVFASHAAASAYAEKKGLAIEGSPPKKEEQQPQKIKSREEIVGKTTVILGKKIGQVSGKSRSVANYRKAPGDLTAAANAALHYSAKNYPGQSMLLIAGNSYMNKVYHITPGNEGLAKFTGMGHYKDTAVVVVRPNGEVFNAVATAKKPTAGANQKIDRRTLKASIEQLAKEEGADPITIISNLQTGAMAIGNEALVGLLAVMKRRYYARGRKAFAEENKNS
jgi:hypothetical protein